VLLNKPVFNNPGNWAIFLTKHFAIQSTFKTFDYSFIQYTLTMKQKNVFSTQAIHFPSLFRRMFIGAAIGLLLIGAFLSTVHHPNPAWGTYWMVRPLIVVPLAGAAGGAFYYFMDYLGNQLGWNKTLVVLISLFVYIVGLWLGSVLGLDGTLWN
jgi:hypothetical protein